MRSSVWTALVFLLAPMAVADGPAEPSRTVWTLNGYIKLDAAIDDSRVNSGNFARWVESESVLDDAPPILTETEETEGTFRINRKYPQRRPVPDLQRRRPTNV